MQRLVILALLFSIFLVGCSQPEEKKVLCPAENYKLLGKDFKEPGWVVGDADSSGFEIMFKEWKQILLTRASCSYQGVAVKTTSAGVGLTHKRPSTLERWTSPFLARERMNRLNFM